MWAFVTCKAFAGGKCVGPTSRIDKGGCGSDEWAGASCPLVGLEQNTHAQTSHASALRIACISRDEVPRVLQQSA